MPDKEFEAKVRDSLEALNLEPSPEVWKELSVRIRTGKKRRILFWLPLLLLLVGMGAWRIWYRGQPETRNSATGQSATPHPATGQPPIPRPAISRSGTPHPATTQSESGSPSISQSETGSAAIGQSATNRPEIRIAETGISKTGTSEFDWRLLAPSTGLPPDPYAFNPVTAAPYRLTPPMVDTPLHALQGAFRDPVVTHGWRKWQNRIYAGAGVSGQGAFLRFYTPMGSTSGVNNPASYYNSRGGSASAVGAGSGGNNYKTAARRSGAGLEAGFEEQYRFARQWKIQAGLEYAYWETAFARVTNPGASLSASSSPPATLSNSGYPQNIYVASATGQVYLNRYSLFQLPVGISWLIAPSRRWNPSLYTGISLGYLAGRHVLQYTPDSITYRAAPPDLLRHWSVYWEAGFDVDVYHWRTNLLYLGPVIQYGLSGLQTQGSVKDHLNYAGLRLGIGFR